MRAEVDAAIAKVDSLCVARAEDVRVIIPQLQLDRREVKDILQKRHSMTNLPKAERDRYALALVSIDPGLLGGLYGTMLEAEPSDFFAICQALDQNQYRSKLSTDLWDVLDNNSESNNRRLCAATALARYAPDVEERWSKVIDRLADMLVTDDLKAVGLWAIGLRVKRKALINPLLHILNDKQRRQAHREVALSSRFVDLEGVRERPGG